MVIGSLGDFVFSSHERGGAVVFNSLTVSRSSRTASHTTIEGAPIVEFLGLDAATVSLSGTLTSEISGDLDDAAIRLLELQDGQQKVLTRGSRVYGSFIVQSISLSEDAWNGAELAALSFTIELVATRG